MDRIRMNERDLQAEEALARCCVDELYALTGESGQRGTQVVHFVGHVVHSRPSLGEELAHRRIVAGRREQLDAAVTDQHGRCLDTLVGNRRAVLELSAEKSGIRVQSFVEVVDGDSEMMDAANVHASDANEGSEGSEELEAVAEWVRGIKTLVPGKLVVPEHLADALGEGPQLFE